MEWVFETLGIDRQADVKTIRKAYARALKQCDQATEADRFQRIRQAYEWALRQAEQASGAATALPEPASPDVEQELPPAVRPLPARPSPVDDAHQLASQVFAEFAEAASAPGAPPLGTLLASVSQDARLTSLDAKMVFEQAVLVRAFAAPADVHLLDEATDMFAWETSNRHLVAVRPDLVHRLRRHQILRQLLGNDNGADHQLFVEAVQLHALCHKDSTEKAMPWQVADANRLLDRYASFRHELNERFGAEPFRWWQEQLRSNATLLRAYEERLQAPASPAQHRPRQRTGGSSFNWIFLLPLLGVVHLIGGSLSSSRNEQQPVYEPPRVQIAPAAPQLPHSPLDENYMRDMAQQGHPDAQNQLGEKIKQNATDASGYRDAFEWFQKAAKRGHAPAQYNLGLMYEEGQGTAQDPVKALELIRQAAANGHAEAQFHLGAMYKEGRVVKVDIQQALLWWEKAAAQHHLMAQYRIGELYAKGEGIEQSYEAAARWWGPAALSGNADAQIGMGSLSERGLGVPQSDSVALRWYRNAATQGSVAGLTKLASMYERGVAVAKNPVIADALLRVAASRNGPVLFNTTPAMASLEHRLSDQQRYEARLLAGALAGDLGSARRFAASLDKAASVGVISSF